MKTDQGERRVSFGSREIAYTLHTMQRKRLRIVVRPDLSIQVDAPEGFDEEEIATAVRSKGRWLVRQLDELASFHPLPKAYRYVSGETFVYLGRQYRLKVAKGERAPAKLRGRYLHVSVEDKGDPALVKSAVEQWYRSRATEVYARSIDRCLNICQRHGADRPALTIRRMKTRWGSCSATGNMLLNLHLVQTPVHCIDYVVMHELCHTIEHNHSPAFYRILTTCMPDWQKRKAVLNQFPVRA